MRPRAWIASVAVAGVVLVGAAGATVVTLAAGPLTIEDVCAEEAAKGPWERQNCAAKFFVDQYLAGRSANEINREMQYRYFAGDAWVGRGCHVPTHALGDAVKQTTGALPSADLDGMFLYCDVGYAHGLTSEYDFSNPKYTEDALIDYVNACARYTREGSRTAWSCDHGIGHIVGTLTFDPDQDPKDWLKAGIARCEKTAARDVDACISGHLMMWNLIGSADLQENPDGWQERWFTTWPDLCDSLPAKYQRGCLEGIADAHGMYFGPDRPNGTESPYCPGTSVCPVPTPQETAARCNTYTTELRVSCYQGLGADRNLQLRDSTTLIEEICGNAPGRAEQEACFLYALQSFEDPLTNERCAQLAQEHQWVCPKVTASQDELIREALEQRQLAQEGASAATTQEFLADCLLLTRDDTQLCNSALSRVRAAGAFAPGIPEP